VQRPPIISPGASRSSSSSTIRRSCRGKAREVRRFQREPIRKITRATSVESTLRGEACCFMERHSPCSEAEPWTGRPTKPRQSMPPSKGRRESVPIAPSSRESAPTGVGAEKARSRPERPRKRGHSHGVQGKVCKRIGRGLSAVKKKYVADG